MNDNIIWLLEQWGVWSRLDGTDSLTDCTSVMFVGLIAPTTHTRLVIADDKAMMIDSLILQLKQKNPDAYQVIVMRYYYNMTTSTISRRLKINRHKAQRLEEVGRAYIDGVLQNITVTIKPKRKRKKNSNPHQLKLF